MSFFSALTLIFIVLKLTEVIAWSWWLVLLPFYGAAALGITLLFIAWLGNVAFLNRRRF